jgi:hypothetical protein
MTDAILHCDSGNTRREIRLDDYLDADAAERATAGALAWIKSIRRARVDDETLRQRFTFRGDSLWWFAELYLHKQQVVQQLFRTIAALDALAARERPRSLQWVRGPAPVRDAVAAFAAARGLGYQGRRPAAGVSAMTLAAMDTRAGSLHASALASRLRARTRPERSSRTDAAVFVHRAFWRGDSGEGSAESYIGPVLTALEQRLARERVAYVSVGPSANFRARRWWHPLRSDRAAAVTAPVEVYAPLKALTESRRVWRDRHRARRALWASRDLRDLSVIHGCDCWPILQQELAGIALLQWPWSARAMDEAGAALDALAPRAAVTYAEAGGWGRAVVLECRRRGVPSVGLQHGFIYRHWLNYLHEPDEMAPDPARPGDAGFPHPTVTALFDGYAAEHLSNAGHFPAGSLAITGSPRLDALAAEAAALTPEKIALAREAAGAGGKHLVVVTTKQREAERVLPALIEAAGAMSDVHVVIKTHPAETPDVYAPVASGRANVSVLGAAAALAPLLRACRAVVTVNSTVALDAAVLDVPGLAIGLPNNLSPFVDAGVLAGAGGTGPLRHALEQILYDEEFRGALARARRTFLTRYSIAADGRAAERTAGVVLRLIEDRGGA